MQVSEDFVLPPLESEKPIYSEERASEEAFYAAASIGENPIDDYETIVFHIGGVSREVTDQAKMELLQML